MSLLPIAERELRVAAKNRATFRARTIFALVGSLVAAALVLVGSAGAGRQIGGTLFPTLSALAFLYCLVAGARATADTLSEEKREGTLGLLFLTDLRGFDVVTGKLAASSIRSFQGLLAFFPVLAISLVLGGVTPGEFWRTALVLIGALWYALALGLAISACTRQAAVALIGTFGLLGGVTLLPLLFNWVTARLGFSAAWLITLSPASGLRWATDLAYHANRLRYWGALGQMALVSCSWLVLAMVVLPRSWQERHAAPRTRTRVRASAENARRRVWMLEVNPIFWLAARNEGQRGMLWLLICAIAIAEAAVMLLGSQFGGATFGVPVILNFVLGVVLKLTLAWAACATLAEARRTGAMELLLATPIKTEEIIYGHWQALRRWFLGPTVAALVLRALPQIQNLLQEPLYRGNVRLFLWLPVPAWVVLSLGTFLLDLVAIAWVGLWMGLTRPKAIQAFARTVLLVMILPALTFCLPNLLFDLFWIVWARRKLQEEFRQAAAARYSTVADSWFPWSRAPVAKSASAVVPESNAQV